MRALPTYSRTKPTTIPWIGEVPEHWEVVPLKFFVEKIGSGLTPRGGSETYVDKGVPLLRSQNVHFDGLRLDDVAFISDEVHASMANSKVFPGEVLLNITGASIGRCCMIDVRITEANVNQHVCRIRTSEQLRHDFLARFLSSDEGQLQISLTQVGTSREGLTLDDLRNFSITVPPLPEQTHIARYLSCKTALIDAYLARKRRMMALLKEQRQALISQAVTKGLDPNAPMKDSGVEWIGEVPEHWEVKRIKHLGTIDNSGCWGADEGEEAGLRPVSTTAHLTMDGLWLKDEMPVRWFTADEIERYAGRIGDIIIVKSSGSAANIISGKAGIIGEDDEGMIFSNFLMRIRPTDVEPLFLYYFLTSHLTRERIEMMVSATTYPNLKVDEYFNHLIPLPDRSEQQAIVGFISDKLVQINDELTRIQTSMERVQEYRQALISAVVTGKVDVRGVEVPEIDQTMSGSEDQTMEEEAGMSAVDVLDEEA